MMNYDEFTKNILERLERDIPNPKQIRVEKVDKTNGVRLDALVILEKDMNLTPSLYLQDFYNILASGKELDEVYDNLLKVYREHRPEQRVDVGFFTDFNRVKDTIMFKLIHYEKNKELLQDVPHIKFLDLAMVCYSLLFLKPEVGSGTVLVHKAHLEYWNISEQELFEIAKKNTQEQLPPQFFAMPDVSELESMDKDELFIEKSLEGEQEDIRMYILTNKADLYGASCILYTDFLQSLAEKAEVDFYILPSSVHETILVPTLNNDCISDFNKMVKAVNQTAIYPHEILSDHAYYYSRAEQKISY